MTLAPATLRDLADRLFEAGEPQRVELYAHARAWDEEIGARDKERLVAAASEIELRKREAELEDEAGRLRKTVLRREIACALMRIGHCACEACIEERRREMAHER